MSRVFIISKEHPQSALKLFSLSITTNLLLQPQYNFPFLCLLVLSEVLDTTDLSLLFRSSSAQCSHTVLSSDQDGAPSQCSSGSLPGVVSSLLTLHVGSPQDSAFQPHSPLIISRASTVSIVTSLWGPTGLHLQSQPQS